MKTILVPTDLSPVATYALDVAVALARANRAEIILLHTVLNEFIPALDPNTGLAYDSTPFYQDALKEAEEALQKISANPDYADVTIRPTLGSSMNGLLSNIAEQHADLIVLGSKGASGILEWLEGSNAELIVRYATCPVLVIKEPVTHFNPQNIVVGIDVDDKLKRQHTYPFQLKDGVIRQFVYVLTPTDNREPDGIRDWFNEFAKSTGNQSYSLSMWHDKTVPEGIIQYAKSANADLIVLYTHGYTGLQHFLQGSVAEDVLNHSKVPVLIMRV